MTKPVQDVNGYRVSLRTDVGLEKTMDLETNFQRATIPRLGRACCSAMFLNRLSSAFM